MSDDSEGTMLKLAVMAGGAFILWKYVWPRFSAAGQLMQRRISEASLRQQYIQSGLREAVDTMARYPLGDPAIAEIQGRMGVLQGKLTKLAADYAAANAGAAIPVLDLTDPALLATYKTFLTGNGWKDPYVGVT